MHIKELRCVANLNCGPISHPPRRLHFCPIYTATCIYRQELSIAVHYAVHYFSSYCRPHKYTRARTQAHTHTYTHCGRTTKGDTLFTINSETPKETTVSRKTNKKKKKVRKNLLFRLQNERDTVIYTRYMERERKRRNEREREKK